MPSPRTKTKAQRPLDVTRAVTADGELSARIKAAARLRYVPVPVPLPTAAATDVAALVKPGKERWPVKTGQDPTAKKVGLAPRSRRRVIVDTTIEELVEMARPADMAELTKRHEHYQKRRAAPVELTIWRITAHVTAVKSEDDGDLHLVLQGESGETMIAEAARPEAAFVGKKNPWLPAMKKSREAIKGKLRASLAGISLVRASTGKFVPLDTFDKSSLSAAALSSKTDAAAAFDAGLAFKARIQPRKARIVGVGFFDRVHGQMGVATTNGVELHPVFDFKWLE
jgi:hypothetical protein